MGEIRLLIRSMRIHVIQSEFAENLSLELHADKAIPQSLIVRILSPCGVTEFETSAEFCEHPISG